MVPIYENYRGYTPPLGVTKTVERLLSSIPPGHLAGIESVVLTNALTLGAGKTNRIRGRKQERKACLGFYHPASSDSGPWIELIIDNIVPMPLPRMFRWSFVYDLIFSDTVFHEVGHHLDATIGSPSRTGENAADSWASILRRRYFREHHRIASFLLYGIAKVLRPTADRTIEAVKQGLRR